MTETNAWVIQIGGGYGWFFFEGTEAEAENMRAQWEQAVGRKRPADPEEIEAKRALRGVEFKECVWTRKPA